MRPRAPHIESLRRLAQMPFIDRYELAALSGRADRSTFDAVADLAARGLVGSVAHATGLLAQSRRFYVTVAGLNHIAQNEGIGLDEILREYPVPDHWRRLLLQRLDAVGHIYRLASSVAYAAGPLSVRWYRGLAVDAAFILPGNRVAGVVRQGATSDRTGFGKRLWRLFDGPAVELTGPPFDTILVLVPDAIRLAHVRRNLERAQIQAFAAVEQDAVLARPDDAVWYTPSVSTALDLRWVVSHVSPAKTVPVERPPQRVTVPIDIETNGTVSTPPPYLLPVLLTPSEKRTLDLLSDWPWISQRDLGEMLSVTKGRVFQIMDRLEGAFGLVTSIPNGRGRRLALTDRGLALLARRDRTAVGTALHRWSIRSTNGKAPADWRNVSGTVSRQLLRAIEHTDAVHLFMARLADQARSRGFEVVQLDPTRRASRYFRYQGRLHSVRPDAFGMLRKGGLTWPFFLEWERRAVRPTTMAARLAPYVRYYSTRQPVEDHGAMPRLLVVFDDPLAEARFLGLARAEIERSGVVLPIRVSNRIAIEERGPLGRVWRSIVGNTPRSDFPGSAT